MGSIVEWAPAKVNLTLRVLGRRRDGYHALESLVVFADVADGVALDPGQPDGFSQSGPTADRIDGENLVARVLAMAQQAATDLAYGHFHLDKQLPVAAGVGGGSADAAAAIRAILRRHPGALQLTPLVASATKLGADIPACLLSRALLMRGIGEDVSPIGRFAPVDAVLATPGVPLSTATVFKTLAAAPVPDDAGTLSWPTEINGLDDLVALIADRPNDLEPPARQLVPKIGEALAALGTLPGCRLSRMSGSGPTCFGLFSAPEAAEAASAALSGSHPDWWVTATTLG